MALQTGFQFSQGSLQDYVDCPRRFQLRYLQRVAWPALESEPALENERYMKLGAQFHKLIHQHLLGVPGEQLTKASTSDILSRWWSSYLSTPPADLPPARHPEMTVSASVGGYRLMAKYDMVAAEAGARAVIVDWKTSRHRPRRAWLADRLQTRVYPYLLVLAGSQLNGGQPLQPEQVEMVYWFANYPGDPEHFQYDTSRHEADQIYLTSLILDIVERTEYWSEDQDQEHFGLANEDKLCRYCPYRSLCQRGVSAGPLDGMEDDLDLKDFEFELDFEQIAEASYL